MTGDSKGFGRRVFIKCLGWSALLLAAPRAAWGRFIKRFPVRTVEKHEFRFDAEAGELVWSGGRREPYVLRVEGLVEAPASFSYKDLKALPRTEQTSDFHCVEGWSVADLKWTGFRFRDLYARIQPLAEAKYAVFHGIGQTRSQPQGWSHYVESLPLSRLLDEKEEIILAYGLNGAPLPDDHGAPLRVISPYDLAYKSIKFVERIELSDKPQAGWWTLANPIYSIKAPVPKSRLRDR